MSAEVLRSARASLRFGDWGPGYLAQGDDAAFGVVVLRPGDEFANHLHEHHTESFVVIEGSAEIWLDRQAASVVSVGDVLRAEPGRSTSCATPSTRPSGPCSSRPPGSTATRSTGPGLPTPPPSPEPPNERNTTMSAQRRSSLRPTRRRAAAALAALTASGLVLAGCASGGGVGRRRQDAQGPHRRSPGGRGQDPGGRLRRETGTKVEVEVVPYDQIQTKAILDAQSGTNNYDVIQYWYTSVGRWPRSGALEDITDWVKDDADIDADDFIQSIFGPYTQYDGKTYGLPIDGDMHVLFYNKEILERNGVEVPTTWEDVPPQPRRSPRPRRQRDLRVCVPRCQERVQHRLVVLQPPRHDDPRDDRPADAAAEHAGGRRGGAGDAGRRALRAASPLEIGFEQALPQFLSGNVAMIEFWTDLGTFAQDPEQSKVVDKWGVAPLPVGPQGHVAGALDAGWAMGISPNASDEDLAKEFVAFASSKATNEKLITTTGSGVDPIRTSTLESEKYKEFAPAVAAVAAEVFPNAQSWPTSPAAPEMLQSLNDNLALVLQGSLTAEQAMSQTWDAWQKLKG